MWPAGKLFWSPCHVCSFLCHWFSDPSPCASPTSLTPPALWVGATLLMGSFLCFPLFLSHFQITPQACCSFLSLCHPLSLHPGLPHQPGAETFRWLLCTVIPFPRGEHGIEAAGPGAAREAEILIKENLDERTECSELCSPPRSHCPACPGRASRVGEGSAVPVC